MKITPHKLRGKITPPPSKSYLHREIIGALLCEEKTTIHNIYLCEDIKATLNILDVFQKKYYIKNNSLTVQGKSISNHGPIDCKESGSSLRFLIPVSMALEKENTFLLGDQLDRRPLNTYFDIFNNKNISYEKTPNNLKIHSTLTQGNYYIKGNISSQFISGLLFALPIVGDSKIILTDEIESKPYIDITLDVLKKFGINIDNNNYKEFIIKKQIYKPCELNTETDWTQSAFWYCLKEKYPIEILNTNKNSLQGDRIILNLLPNLPKEFNASHNPDIVPYLCAYAIGTNQEVTFTHCQRLKYKECDRLNAINEFKKVGGNIQVFSDRIIIKKSEGFHSSKLNTFKDHRMIMAFTLFAYLTDTEIEISYHDAVRKSYFDFWTILSELEKL